MKLHCPDCCHQQWGLRTFHNKSLHQCRTARFPEVEIQEHNCKNRHDNIWTNAKMHKGNFWLCSCPSTLYASQWGSCFIPILYFSLTTRTHSILSHWLTCSCHNPSPVNTHVLCPPLLLPPLISIVLSVSSQLLALPAACTRELNTASPQPAPREKFSMEDQVLALTKTQLPTRLERVMKEAEWSQWAVQSWFQRENKKDHPKVRNSSVMICTQEHLW